MSDSKAGQMAASMAWAFAIGSVVVALGLGFALPGFLGWIVTAALFGGAGWAAVHMTQASTGKGILTMLVAGLVAGVASFIVAKMMVSSAMTAGGSQAFQEAMKQKSATMTPEQQAQMQQLGGAMAGGFGVLAGVVMFFGSLIKVFLCGMIGCFIGGATKKSALGASGAIQKAA